ncbi:MAG: diguanylate cyclase domain-containing protein [Clostridiaceae bacterium]
MIKITGLAKEKKKVLLYSIILCLALSFIYLIVAVILKINTNSIKKDEIIKNEKRLISVEKNILTNNINDLTSDLLYITDNLNEHYLNETELKQLINEWINFSDRKKIYDQMRFISADGDEIIRINYLDSGSILVSENKLQNKKDRYYFQDTIGLKKGQVYISKMDLNVENEEVEQPIKPMIRLSTPVYDENNKLIGIVVLNYYSKYLLEEYENIASTSMGNVFLLNSEGYWIYNDMDKEKEWSFMYEDSSEIRFSNEYPDEWKKINEKEYGTFTTKSGYYSYANIMPVDTQSSNSIVLGGGDWVAVSYLSGNTKNGEMFFSNIVQNILYILKTQSYVFILIFAISVVFSILITMNKISNERIKYFSEYDEMTGVYNRRAGFEMLEKTYREIMKNAGNISVCFIDINGLKEVNDNLGHEAGDELILSIVTGIKKFIRQTDYITRLGGDEFLIVFKNMDQEQTESVWSRINQEYKDINETENRKYMISASHGISEFKLDSNEYIDNIVNSADEKMYIEKRIIKKDLEIIRKDI